MKKGERFRLQTAGGGGLGDPKARDPEALQRDVAEGYVTPDGAARDYNQKI